MSAYIFPKENTRHNQSVIIAQAQTIRAIPSALNTAPKAIDHAPRYTRIGGIFLVISSLSNVQAASTLTEASFIQPHVYHHFSNMPPKTFRAVKQKEESYTDEELFAAMPLDYEVNIPPRSSRTVKARVVSVQRGTPSVVNLEEL